MDPHARPLQPQTSPAVSLKIQLIAFNCRYSHSCLALFYVRQALEQALPSSSIAIRQYTINDPYHETLLRISDEPAEALFFSVYIWNATYLRRLLTDLHAIAPKLAIVLGGPQAPALREQLRFRPTVVHQAIEGINPEFYRDLQDGSLRSDYHSAPVNTFPFPYKQEDFASQLKNRQVYYEASRGCPFHCEYCLSSISRGVVNKDLELVQAELMTIIGQGPTMIRFVDRTFNADGKRALALWRFLVEHGASCSFHFEIAPDLFTDEMLTFLAEVPAGLFQFEIGIQSTNRRTLAAINRTMHVERALATIKRLVALGTIHLHLDLILGLPEDDSESFGQSVRDLLALRPHYLQMGLLKVLPDTPLCRKREDYGIVACEEPPYQVLATRWLDQRTMSDLYWLGECVEAFYNKGYFTSFLRFVLDQEDDSFAWFRRLTAFCRQGDFFAQAKTQALMNDLLVSFCHDHGQAPLLRQFLLFDWLRSGHRFLPEALPAPLTEHRNFLWAHAPEAVAGLYTTKERNLFFKRGVFCRFAAELLAHTGVATNDHADGFVGFFTEHGAKTQVVAMPLTNGLADR